MLVSSVLRCAHGAVSGLPRSVVSLFAAVPSAHAPTPSDEATLRSALRQLGANEARRRAGAAPSLRPAEAAALTTQVAVSPALRWSTVGPRLRDVHGVALTDADCAAILHGATENAMCLYRVLSEEACRHDALRCPHAARRRVNRALAGADDLWLRLREIYPTAARGPHSLRARLHLESWRRNGRECIRLLDDIIAASAHSTTSASSSSSSTHQSSTSTAAFTLQARDFHTAIMAFRPPAAVEAPSQREAAFEQALAVFQRMASRGRLSPSCATVEALAAVARTEAHVEVVEGLFRALLLHPRVGPCVRPAAAASCTAALIDAVRRARVAALDSPDMAGAARDAFSSGRGSRSGEVDGPEGDGDHNSVGGGHDGRPSDEKAEETAVDEAVTKQQVAKALERAIGRRDPLRHRVTELIRQLVSSCPGGQTLAHPQLLLAVVSASSFDGDDWQSRYVSGRVARAHPGLEVGAYQAVDVAAAPLLSALEPTHTNASGAVALAFQQYIYSLRHRNQRPPASATNVVLLALLTAAVSGDPALVPASVEAAFAVAAELRRVRGAVDGQGVALLLRAVEVSVFAAIAHSPDGSIPPATMNAALAMAVSILNRFAVSSANSQRPVAADSTANTTPSVTASDDEPAERQLPAAAIASLHFLLGSATGVLAMLPAAQTGANHDPVARSMRKALVELEHLTSATTSRVLLDTHAAVVDAVAHLRSEGPPANVAESASAPAVVQVVTTCEQLVAALGLFNDGAAVVVCGPSSAVADTLHSLGALRAAATRAGLPATAPLVVAADVAALIDVTSPAALVDVAGAGPFILATPAAVAPFYLPDSVVPPLLLPVPAAAAAAVAAPSGVARPLPKVTTLEFVGGAGVVERRDGAPCEVWDADVFRLRLPMLTPTQGGHEEATAYERFIHDYAPALSLHLQRPLRTLPRGMRHEGNIGTMLHRWRTGEAPPKRIHDDI